MTKGEYLAPSNNETAKAKVKTTLTNKNPNGPPELGVSSKPTLHCQETLTLVTETSTGVRTTQLLQTSKPRKPVVALIFICVIDIV